MPQIVNFNVLRPDGFAIILFVLGLILLIVPMMVMVGIIAIVAAVGYWFTMTAIKFISRRRARR